MKQITQYDHDSGDLPQVAGDMAFRAEIDIQVSTANAYPRKLARVAAEIRDLVTITPAAAAACVYTLPRDGKAITGPSIRLAEILFSSWGNCTGGSRITEVNKKEGYIEAEGAFWDLQKNAKTVRRFRRRITNKQGKVFSDDMIIVTGQAAGSIAFRNAVLSGIPRAIWNEAYEAAEAVIRGDIKTLGERHDASMKALHAFGFTADDVYKVLEIGGRQEFTLDHIVTLTGLYTSLKDGATTKEQIMRDVGVIDATPSRAVGSIAQRATATGPRDANPAADAALEAEARRVADDHEKAATKKREEEEKAAHTKAMKEAEARIAEQAEAEAPTSDDEGIATDPAALDGYFDAILSDLLDDMPPDVVQVNHAAQIAAIKANNTALYDRLMGEINAA